MADKTINGRLVQKHDVQSNWEKATNFVPLAGETIYYDPDENFSYTRVKVGDGSRNVNSLPFVDDNKVDKIAGKGLSSNDFTDEEKAKLSALDPNAASITVDSTLSTTSENPVQNKVINAALTNKSDSGHKHAAMCFRWR